MFNYLKCTYLCTSINDENYSFGLSPTFDHLFSFNIKVNELLKTFFKYSLLYILALNYVKKY